MLNRYRWYRVQLPRGGGHLSGLLASYPLTSACGFGFSSIDAPDSSSTYRFLWRTKIVATILDDSGAPTYQEIDSISFTDFSILSIDGQTFLRVENPGRSIREFLNALESIIGLGFTSKLVTFEHARPTTIFEEIKTVRLIGFKVLGVVLDEDLVARMEFASKQGMTLSQMKFLEGRPYKVDSATYEMVHEGIRGQLSFLSNGTVKVGGQLAPKLMQLIEEDLPKIV